MNADWVNQPQENLRVGGVILCGGESRRMGESKAWLKFGDEFLLQRIAGVVAEAASPVVLASRREVELPPIVPEFRVVYDEFENGGPLAGIAAGMISLQEECDAVLVAACDHPFVSAAICRRMMDVLGDHAAVVPELSGKLFPTLSLYRLSTLEILEGMLRQRELRAREFARRCNPRRVGAAELADIDPDLRSFCNLNNPSEFVSALVLADCPSSKDLPCER